MNEKNGMVFTGLAGLLGHGMSIRAENARGVSLRDPGQEWSRAASGRRRTNDQLSGVHKDNAHVKPVACGACLVFAFRSDRCTVAHVLLVVPATINSN